LALLSRVFRVHFDGDLSDAGRAKSLSFTETLDNNLRVHTLFDELLGGLEEFTSGKHDGGSTVSNLVVLRLSDIDESLSSGVDNVKEGNESSSIIGNSD
jgi:hypothetical protein